MDRWGAGRGFGRRSLIPRQCRSGRYGQALRYSACPHSTISRPSMFAYGPRVTAAMLCFARVGRRQRLAANVRAPQSGRVRTWCTTNTVKLPDSASLCPRWAGQSASGRCGRTWRFEQKHEKPRSARHTGRGRFPNRLRLSYSEYGSRQGQVKTASRYPLVSAPRWRCAGTRYSRPLGTVAA